MINLSTADQVGGRSRSVRRAAVSERRTVPLQPADSGHRPAHLQQPGRNPTPGSINGLLSRHLKAALTRLSCPQSPGQYYFKPMMKEFRFEPASQMITVEEGQNLDIDITGIKTAYRYDARAQRVT